MGSSKDLFLVFLVIVFLSVNFKCGLGARDLTTTLSKDNHYVHLQDRIPGNNLGMLRAQKAPKNNPKFAEDRGDVALEEPENGPESQADSNTEKTPKGSNKEKPVVPEDPDNEPAVTQSPESTTNQNSEDEKPVVPDDPDNEPAVTQCPENTAKKIPKHNKKPVVREDPDDEPAVTQCPENTTNKNPNNKKPVVPEDPDDEPAVTQCSGNTTNENPNAEP